MSTGKHGAGGEQAERMLQTLASFGVQRLDVTLTDCDGHKQSFCPAVDGEQLRRQIGWWVDSAVKRQCNLIVRPRGARVRLIQLDDLAEAALERVRPAAFLILATSPGNHQAWVAVPEGTPDLVRRLRQACGADPSASGATRIAGSLNFKRKYAPDFPTVQLLEMSPQRLVTETRLQALGLVATSAPPRPPARVSPRRQVWPSYQCCLQNAPRAHQSDRPDVSRADFTFALIALDWGWSQEQTCQRLGEHSPKARQQGERYVRLTVQRANEALQRRRLNLASGRW